MTPDEMREKAMDLFNQRFHCSQSVLAPGQEKMGVVNEEVVKALGLFGGGFAGSGHTCGALAGGIALISSLHSRGNLEEKENPRMWALGLKLIAVFTKLTQDHGGITCRDIARVNWQDPVQVKDYYKNPESRKNICKQLIGDTAYELGRLLEEEAAKDK